MSTKKQFHIEDDNMAVPEIHSDDFNGHQKTADEEENRERNETEILYDNVAIPEIHIRRKKKK